MALLKNDSRLSNDVLTLGGNLQAMKEQLSERNDTVLIVVDETRLDEVQRRRKGLELLENHIAAKSRDNHFVSVLISNHMIPELQPEQSCTLVLNDYNCHEEPSNFRRILQKLDATFIKSIEKNYGNYEAAYRKTYYSITQAVPKTIPPHRRQVYICLLAAARMYDTFFKTLFGTETEHFVEAWLSEENEQPGSLSDELFRRFGKVLNEELASGRFRYIQRSKFITFDKGTDSVIVDEDNIYFETKVIKELAEDKLGLHNVNALTDMLKECDCLTINDHHSKSYRFTIQSSDENPDSDEEPDMVYTYGISKVLINSANRRLLSLAGKSDFLLTQTEFEQHDMLPLGVVANGRFIGKAISRLKGNDHIFITGRSGRGKTFYATNLLPPFAMLGGNSIVVDASGSFIREEVLLALPQDVVDALFDFIAIGVGEAKLPVNPLFIGDCNDLPAKKRRIVGFVKAAAGKLSKDDTRVIAGLISKRLMKRNDITTFTTGMLRETLEKGGSIGRNALGLIESVLDDMEAIGCEDKDWGTFFAHSAKIPVILLGDSVGDNVHQLVDVLLNSLFEWQHDHAAIPLTITIDEVKRQSFADGSPLHTIMSQGRKYRIRFIGITQDYISNDSHAIDVMKQAGTQIFFEPAKSQDRIAKDLGYKDAADAGLGSMGIGECIIRSDLYSTKDGCNTKAVVPCSTVKFVESPFYERFKVEYQIADPSANTAESPGPYEVSQPERAEAPANETVSEVQELSTTPLTIPAPDEKKSESSEVEMHKSQLSESADDVPEEEATAEEALPEMPRVIFIPLTPPPPDEMNLEPSVEKEQMSQPPEPVNSVLETVEAVPEAESSETTKPESVEVPASDSAAAETAEASPEIEIQPAPPESEPDEPEEAPQERIERELQTQFQDLKHCFSPDYPGWRNDLAKLFIQLMEKRHFATPRDRDKLKNRLDSFLWINPKCSDYREQLDALFKAIWPSS